MLRNQQSASGDSQAQQREEQKLRRRMSQIRRKLVVVSGKGGVGKSTVAANLAIGLSMLGSRVGLLDVDIHGPSIPTILGSVGSSLVSDGECILPVEVHGRLAMMSIGFLLGNQTDAVIWRGPMKMKLIQQFLRDVAWGDLDYLVVDCPPGTGDEPISVTQLIGRPAAAVVVTTPQELALADVRRCITFCRKAGLPIAGVLENMSGYVCPRCGVHADLFGTGGGEKLSSEMGIAFLGRIPIDPRIVGCGDAGRSLMEEYPESAATQSYLALAANLQNREDLWHDSATASGED